MRQVVFRVLSGLLGLGCLVVVSFTPPLRLKDQLGMGVIAFVFLIYAMCGDERAERVLRLFGMAPDAVDKPDSQDGSPPSR